MSRGRAAACCGVLLLALAGIVAATGGLPTLVSITRPATFDPDRGLYPEGAEISTRDARAVALVRPATLGGTLIQIAVVLACPAMFVAMWFMQRRELRAAPRHRESESVTDPRQGSATPGDRRR